MSLIHEVSDLFRERKGSTSIHPTWKVIELRKVCEIQNGFAFQSSEFNSYEGVPLIRIRDILKHNPETYYRGAYSDSYIVEKGDLLVGMDGDFNHSLWKGPDALLNQRVCRIIPNQEILLTRFLYYGLGDYLKKINENTSSTTVKHLSSKSIGEIPFALPPLPEQQRIVAKLDAVFGHLDRVREKLDRIPELLKNFRQQVLTQAVTGELTREWREGKGLPKQKAKEIRNSDYSLDDIPNEWVHTIIGTIASVKGGKRLPKEESLTEEITNHPYIRARDLKKGTVLTENLLYITEDVYEKISRYIVNKGDVYITIVGAKIGDAGIIPESMDGANLTENAAKLTDMQNVIPTYLSIWLRSPICQSFIQKTIMSAAQGKLALTRIKSLPIYLPHIVEQEKIASTVDSLFSLADKIESQYQSLKAKIDNLPQAVLAKAFRGELVAQEVKEYLGEVGELGMVAEGVEDYGKE